MNNKEITLDVIKLLINKENPIILDIGCYDGKDSLKLNNVFKNAEVHCFEADPRSVELFEKINSNNNLQLHKVAISNINGKVNFNLSDSETRRHYKYQTSWSASSSLKKPKNHLDLFNDVQFNKTIEVECITLDKWYKEKLNWKAIDFIWVDINGAEEEFIKGALKTLNLFTRFLYIEFSDKELYEGQINKNQILELLNQFELIDIYNYQGNFGNMLLKNKNYERE